MGLDIAQTMCLHCILPSAQSPLTAMLRRLADQCIFCDQDCSEGLEGLTGQLIVFACAQCMVHKIAL